MSDGNLCLNTTVAALEAAGNFTSFLAALEATELFNGFQNVIDPVETLTIFAPTDAAFAALGTETIDALFEDPAMLAGILEYHYTFESELGSDTLIALDGQSIEMEAGGSIELSISDGSLFVNNARVVEADIQTDTGLIHVIDKVLTPARTAKVLAANGVVYIADAK